MVQAQSIRFSELSEGDDIIGLVCAWTCEVKRTRHSDPYLQLELRDADMTLIPARMWNTDADRAPACPVVISIQGNVERFREELQIRIHHLELTDDDVTNYVPSTYRPIPELIDEFTGIIDTIRDDELRRLVQACLDDTPDFWDAPSAVNFHGAYRGGLLEHTLNVTRICMGAADVYGGRVNLDLLVAAAVLHDVGKADAYASPENREPRDHERLIGHVVGGVLRVQRVAQSIGYQGDVPIEDLLHALLSHHGELEFGAPVGPCTAEAMILSGADRMEADVTGCFDHWRDKPGSGMWSYSHQRRRTIRRPLTASGFGEDPIDDLPF